MHNPMEARRKNTDWFMSYESRPAHVTEVETPEPEPEPTPVSVRDMTPEQYAAFRAQLGMGQVDQGIFGSGSFREASKAKAGRNGMVTSNVIPAPRIARVTIPEVNESRLDARPLAERFGNQANAYRYGG